MQEFTPVPPRNNWQAPITVACIFLGILVSLQFRAQKDNIRMPVNDKELAKMVKDLESERNKLQTELKDTRGRLTDIEERLSKGEGVNRGLLKNFEEARMQAGLLGMKGPGVEITMDDSQRSRPTDADPYFYIVHDVDLQALVNELWSAGAEAVCINDQRIVNRSSIRCAGPAILVNTVRLSPPYVVRGIGPAADIDRGLRMPGGFLDSMGPLVKNGGEVKLKQVAEIAVPPYGGSLGYRYAQPMKDEEGQAMRSSEPGL